MNVINYGKLLYELKREKKKERENMGLPDNLKYEPTAHFRQRLAERFNIHGMGWRLFMRKLYPKLQFDAEQSERNPEKNDVYLAKDEGIYVVVDTKNKKLITIYRDPNQFEEQLIENIEAVETEKIEGEFSLSDFAEQLIAQEKNLRITNNYRYAQRVIQSREELMKEYMEVYEFIKDHEATPEAIHKMNRLRNLERKIHKLFGQLDLPREDDHAQTPNQ